MEKLDPNNQRLKKLRLQSLKRKRRKQFQREEKKGKAAGGKKEKAPIVKRVPPTQYEILLQVGIPESDIPAF